MASANVRLATSVPNYEDRLDDVETDDTVTKHLLTQVGGLTNSPREVAELVAIPVEPESEPRTVGVSTHNGLRLYPMFPSRGLIRL